MNQNIEKIIENKEFMENIVTLETKEQVKEAFKSQGIEINDDDLELIKKIVCKSIKKGKVISQDELSGISGGGRGRNKRTKTTMTKTTKTTTTYGDNSNNSSDSSKMPAIGGLCLGGAFTLIGIGIASSALYTKVKKGSWFAEM